MTSYGAIDIGGSKVLAGIFNEAGELAAKERFPVGAEREPDAITGRLAAALRGLADREGLRPPEFAGVSVPGPLVRATGVVHLSPNLGWHDYPLGQRLTALLGTPVVLDDDANCAALGEAWKGAGRGVGDFVLLVVGSGVGAGIVINGDLYHGSHDSAGEVGHVPLMRGDGPECGCGKRGCFEALASGRSIARRGRELIELGRGRGIRRRLTPDGEVTAESVFDAAEAGDPDAREAIVDGAEYLGIGLAIVANMFDPAVIVLGGGLGLRGGPYREMALAAMARHGLRQNTARTAVVPAALGDESGLYGAGLLAMRSAMPRKP